MTESDRLSRFLRTKVRGAGRQYEQARQAFTEARTEALADVKPEAVRIVCRRYAERREVTLDSDGRPTCFEAGHPDCEGCVEDIHTGHIETW